jgi:hypothetical protein
LIIWSLLAVAVVEVALLIINFPALGAEAQVVYYLAILMHHLERSLQ